VRTVALRKAPAVNRWSRQPGRGSGSGRSWTRDGCFWQRVRGEVARQTGKRVHNIVNIGISGSDLRPATWPTKAYGLQRNATSPALRVERRQDRLRREQPRSRPESRNAVHQPRSPLRPQETALTNAHSADTVASGALKDESAVAKHFVALSTRHGLGFGFVGPMFEFWDWVGGRYSYDSAMKSR